MKIVYIANSTIPSRTANSIHVMKMCQAFANNGHEVFLLVPDREDNNFNKAVHNVYEFYGVKQNFTIIRLPWLPVKGRGYIYGLLAARKAKTLNPDLVYGRSLPGCFFSSLLKLPVVFESHQPAADSGRISALLFKRMIKYDSLKHLVVISERLKMYYRDNYPNLKKHIFVAHDAADEPATHNNVPIQIDNSGKFRAGYVGHLYPGKGMEVIAELAKRCNWAEFHVVGGMDDDIRKWKNELQGVHNVIFHGFVPHGQTEKYLKTFDVLLAPYQQKVSACGGGNIADWMSPLKLFEYMSAGKPIVCSDLPVLREVLTNEKTALLCPPDDVNSWEHALSRLQQKEDLRKDLGENAKVEFIHNYTWSARAQKLIKQLN